jgi:hypothetical protein
MQTLPLPWQRLQNPQRSNTVTVLKMGEYPNPMVKKKRPLGTLIKTQYSEIEGSPS